MGCAEEVGHWTDPLPPILSPIWYPIVASDSSPSTIPNDFSIDKYSASISLFIAFFSSSISCNFITDSVPNRHTSLSFSFNSSTSSAHSVAHILSASPTQLPSVSTYPKAFCFSSFALTAASSSSVGMSVPSNLATK